MGYFKSTELLAPFRLAPTFSERVWGRPNLLPWYASTGTTEHVGEAWLTGPGCLVETGPFAGRTLASVAAEIGPVLVGESGSEFPLLIKILFPNQKLSVQVHPNDAQAQAIGLPRGKTECWYVLEASPGATVALGLKPGVTAEAVRQSIADGTMEALLQWLPVSVGDTVFVDAGTVHAIGPGVVLLETQQTSDITYRMYDYGRPRELHVEQGLAVMNTRTAAGKIAPRPMDGFVRLIEQTYFIVDRYDLAPGQQAAVPSASPGCLVGLSGDSSIVSANSDPLLLPPGQAVVLPFAAGPATVTASGPAAFVHCFQPNA